MSDAYTPRPRWSDPGQSQDPFGDWRSRDWHPDVLKETVKRLGDPYLRYDPETNAIQSFGTKPDGYIGYSPLKPKEARAAKEQAFGGAGAGPGAAQPQAQPWGPSPSSNTLSFGNAYRGAQPFGAAFNDGAGRSGSIKDNPDFQPAVRGALAGRDGPGPDGRFRDTETPAFMSDLQSDSGAPTHAATPLLTEASFKPAARGAEPLGAAPRQAAAYRRQLSDKDRDIAKSLEGVIVNTGDISPSTLYTMRQSGLRIGDVLGPGIYQVDFLPEIMPKNSRFGIQSPWLYHAQYIYIDPNGESQVLSSGPDENNRLRVIKGSFDGDGPHSLNTIAGYRAEPMHIYNVALPAGASADQMWKLMISDADQISNAGYNYRLLKQNSNSLFFSIAKRRRLGVSRERITPAGGLDLLSPHP